MRLFILTLFISGLSLAQQVDMSVFNQMKARQIGPAGMSGRVTCIDAVESNPSIMYIGTASGGVWKSTSAGLKWEPIADTLACINIGALTIQQSNPDVIWVGTGEGNPRNSQNSGYGLYKSIDAGRSWELVGLENTRNIHRIIIHPNDPNTVWIGAQGQAWGDNENRGVYKTTDGGKTWKHILKGDKSTGIGDLVIDPSNPKKLIAAMWDFRRNPWDFRSGGPGSGIYMTTDGGENWKRQNEENGLPEGELGRCGLAFAPSDPNRVYALVEAKKNQVYRSDDGGYNWYSISSDNNAGNRPFYYSDLMVDPENENRIYSLWSVVSRSEDGGKTWQVIVPYSKIHPDHQAMWINPKDPSHLIVGNDGGLAESRDKGVSWRFIMNLPLAQYYHINVDNMLPYNVYGGMQDNGSWRGPAYEFGGRAIRNESFVTMMYGDGFDVVPDPDDPARYGYAMSQRGYVARYDMVSGYTKTIRPTTDKEIDLRFNWNAAIAQDPNNNSTIYFGSQFVHKSTDKGDSWTIISPDLTTNDTTKQKQLESGGLTIDATGAENYTTILTINPSPKDSKVIWVGTDDGRLHLTTDGGTTWNSLEGKLPDMPEGAWIPQIHPSNHDVNEVFVVANDYRRNDWKPYLFHSTDQGKSWKRIASEEDFPGYCLSVVQDPRQPNLVFVGTEHGLYVSFDHGQVWNHWNNGFPNVSTMDMKIQEREGDLVIGTFGRAAYVIDNLDPLRELAAGNNWTEKKIEMFKIPDAYMANTQNYPGSRTPGDEAHYGQNRRRGARVYVYYDLPDSVKKSKKAKVRIKDASGNVIRNFERDLQDGINYFTWNMDGNRPRFANQEKPKKKKFYGGRPMVPGKYTVVVKVGEDADSSEVIVNPDPRMDFNKTDYQIKQKRYDEAMELMKDMTKTMDKIRYCQKSIEKVEKLLPAEKSKEKTDLSTMSSDLKKQLDGFRELYFGPKDPKGLIREQPIVQDRFWKTMSSVGGALDGAEQSFRNRLSETYRMHEAAKKQVEDFMTNEWEEYKQKVADMNLDPFAE